MWVVPKTVFGHTKHQGWSDITARNDVLSLTLVKLLAGFREVAAIKLHFERMSTQSQPGSLERSLNQSFSRSLVLPMGLFVRFGMIPKLQVDRMVVAVGGYHPFSRQDQRSLEPTKVHLLW
ncbi:hypothetical protein BSKO_13190 [Bryopsis sp. KO-2023]|nr:hypothetical protein BSKO_13190 [Bryopsis sp. KO-2023]